MRSVVGAIPAGYTVQFTAAATLIAGRARAHGERQLDEKLLDCPSRSC